MIVTPYYIHIHARNWPSTRPTSDILQRVTATTSSSFKDASLTQSFATVTSSAAGSEQLSCTWVLAGESPDGGGGVLVLQQAHVGRVVVGHAAQPVRPVVVVGLAVRNIQQCRVGAFVDRHLKARTRSRACCCVVHVQNCSLDDVQYHVSITSSRSPLS